MLAGARWTDIARDTLNYVLAAPYNTHNGSWHRKGVRPPHANNMSLTAAVDVGDMGPARVTTYAHST